MKLSEICEADLIKKGNQLDTAEEDDNNRNKAKRIAAGAKDKAQKANPGESETPVQAHLGGHISSFINR